MQEYMFEWSVPFPGCGGPCGCAQGWIWLASGGTAQPYAYSLVMGIGVCAAGGGADADT